MSFEINAQKENQKEWRGKGTRKINNRTEQNRDGSEEPKQNKNQEPGWFMWDLFTVCCKFVNFIDSSSSFFSAQLKCE